MDEWMDAWMETTKREVARKQPARKIEIGGRRGGGRKEDVFRPQSLL